MSKPFYIPTGTPGIKPEIHWNPITGCDDKPISPGCDNCWAREIAKRFRLSVAGEQFRPEFHEDRLNAPFHWRKPRIVCANFMGDWMADGVSSVWQHDVFIKMKRNPHHTFLTLTKRPGTLEIFCRGREVPANVWLGVSAENQECYDNRLPSMIQIVNAGWKTWWSLEPYLGDDGIALFEGKYRPDWLVIGCESGMRRRLCNLKMMRDVVRQCADLGIPCYVKQIPDADGDVSRNSEDAPFSEWDGDGIVRWSDGWPADLRVRQYPKEFHLAPEGFHHER